MVDLFGKTPLHMAALATRKPRRPDEFADIVHILVECKANVNQQDDKGFTPLLRCMCVPADDARCLMLTALIEAKADMELHRDDDMKYTALQHACRSGCAASVEILLAAGADTKYTNPQGYGIVDAAVAANSMRVVRLLVDKGVPLNQNVKMPVLYVAIAQVKSIELCTDLIGMKADVNPTCPSRVIPVHVACLMACSSHGDARYLSLLCAHGASMDVLNVKGETPLTSACLRGHLNTVELLLNTCKADATLCNRRGDTALIIAVHHKKYEIVEFLCDAACATHHQREPIDVNRANGANQTPLCMAVLVGAEPRMVQTLLDARADVNRPVRMHSTSADDTTVLVVACRMPRRDVRRVRLLVRTASDAAIVQAMEALGDAEDDDDSEDDYDVLDELRGVLRDAYATFDGTHSSFVERAWKWTVSSSAPHREEFLVLCNHLAAFVRRLHDDDMQIEEAWSIRVRGPHWSAWVDVVDFGGVRKYFLTRLFDVVVGVFEHEFECERDDCGARACMNRARSRARDVHRGIHPGLVISGRHLQRPDRLRALVSVGHHVLRRGSVQR